MLELPVVGKGNAKDLVCRDEILIKVVTEEHGEETKLESVNEENVTQGKD